jgi:soluble lytic murein transglycosylase-like protein
MNAHVRKTSRLAGMLLLAGVATGLWLTPGVGPGSPVAWPLWVIEHLPVPFVGLGGPPQPFAASLSAAHDLRTTLSLMAGVPVPASVPDSHLQAILENSAVTGVPVAMYLRIIHHESRFDPTARNPRSGAFGYMQTAPRTFDFVYDALGLQGGRTPSNNLTVGAELLRREFSYWMERSDGDSTQAWRMALASYAVGGSQPRRLRRVPPAAREFVDFVMDAR